MAMLIDWSSIKDMRLLVESLNDFLTKVFGKELLQKETRKLDLYAPKSRPVAILLMPKGVLGVMEGFLLGSLACLIFSAFVLRGRLPDPRGDFSLKEVLSFSLPLYLSNIIALAQGWLDVLILSSAAVPAVTGSYYLVLMGSSILSILWTPLCSALLPVLSSSFGRNGSVEVGAPIRIMTFIVLPPCLSIAAVSRTALSIVYGGYEEMSLILSMFSALSILSAYISLYNVILQAIKYTKPVFSAGALSTAIYIALLPILTPSFGSIGAATCRAFLIATSFLVLHIYVSRRLKADIKFMGRILLMSAIIALPLLLIEFMVDLPGIIKGACEASAFLLLWILAARALRPLSDEDWEILVEAVPIGRSLLSRIIEHE